VKLREAIGALVLDTKDNLIAFRRADFPENWQCPEGGIDAGETPKDALVRELAEEIGLEKNQFKILKRTKTSIPYLFAGGKLIYGFNGQRKIFFLVKLTDSFRGFVYNRKANEIEFVDHSNVTAEQLVGLVPEFKKNLYRSVLEEFGML
jgi:putative (di)nucleoside polyphosphate hydrolase